MAKVKLNLESTIEVVKNKKFKDKILKVTPDIEVSGSFKSSPELMGLIHGLHKECNALMKQAEKTNSGEQFFIIALGDDDSLNVDIESYIEELP